MIALNELDNNDLATLNSKTEKRIKTLTNKLLHLQLEIDSLKDLASRGGEMLKLRQEEFARKYEEECDGYKSNQFYIDLIQEDEDWKS